MSNILVLYLVVFFTTLLNFAHCCSIPPDHDFLSVAELTRLAPWVVQGEVVATDEERSEGGLYNATVNITHVFKGSSNITQTQIAVAGFGSPSLCRSGVDVGKVYIVFLQNVRPFQVRFDDISASVAVNSSQVIHQVHEGLCCPNTTACPKITFKCSSFAITPSKGLLFAILLILYNVLQK